MPTHLSAIRINHIWVPVERHQDAAVDMEDSQLPLEDRCVAPTVLPTCVTGVQEHETDVEALHVLVQPGSTCLREQPLIEACLRDMGAMPAASSDKPDRLGMVKFVLLL